MKTKKILIASCLILALTAIFATPAYAVWTNCNVVRVGPSGNRILIMLKSCDGAFIGNRWYYLVDSSKKTMMAAALTAMTNSWQVRVNITSYDAYNTITNMYLTKTAECN